ncbi:MAG: hypothetical protein HY901_17555 [Deltaproteobacteria bacterium]|nr:hypothetical protein [Deltaproteobacteria bacterium]
MKPLPDSQLNRLLAGRDQLTQADKDAVLEQVFARLPAEPAKRWIWGLSPALRWACAATALLLMAPAGYLLLASRPSNDAWTARGGQAAKPSFSVLCAQAMTEGRCAREGKLLFRVEPMGARWFAALAVNAAGDAIWYFTEVDLSSVAASGLLGVGVPLGPEHVSGRYEVVGVFSDRQLGKQEIRSLLDSARTSTVPQAEIVRRSLEVLP